MAASNATFVPPTTTQNSLLKLDGDNYTNWVTQINLIRRTYDLMDLVEGKEPCPPKLITDVEGKSVSNPESLNWNRNDQYLLSIITSSLSEKVLANVYGLNTSHQASYVFKFPSKNYSSRQGFGFCST